jgi:hypothetical protein
MYVAVFVTGSTLLLPRPILALIADPVAKKTLIQVKAL